jgi:hypothetical protein
MATPKIIADFETQLATALAVGGTSFTLSSATDDDGVSLPNGLYYFTVDNGTSQKEYLAGTLAGTSVTSVLTVSRQGAEVSGAARAHRVGASVIITDFATYKKYMDEISLAGASDADTSTKGVLEAATTAEIDANTATGSTGASLSVAPDKLVLSKYGLRLPGADEKAALAGGATFGTPSTSNKYITQDYNSSATGIPVVRTYLNAGSPATWTRPAGLKYIIVEVQAGGGGGGGTDTTTGSAASGGGGGGYSKKLIPVASLGATETVTTGAGGAAGGASADGSAGGNSSFGTHATATGGDGGQDYNNKNFAAGGTAASGDINIKGGGGGIGINGGASGWGGNSQLGGITPPVGAGSSGTDGITGYLYGSGGSGAYRIGGGSVTGGAGAAGLVRLTEYYS